MFQRTTFKKGSVAGRVLLMAAAVFLCGGGGLTFGQDGDGTLFELPEDYYEEEMPEEFKRVPFPARPTAAQLENGKQVYFTKCVWCHGVDGAGDGPAADLLWPRPRNFVGGTFKIRRTASGELPLMEDLFDTVTHGLPGSVMPSWEGVLSEEQRRNVVMFVMTKLMKDRSLEDAEFETFTRLRLDELKPIPPSPESIKKGAELFKANKCLECHGDNGRGDGNPINLKDDWGFAIQPRNLHKCWNIRGSRRDPYNVKNIFRTFSTGLNGTPMPSFADNVTVEDRWHLANFVQSLCERDAHGKPLALDRATNRPTGQPVIPVGYVSGAIPADPNAAAWKSGPKRFVGMGGQVTHKPRNFVSLNVDDLWVQAIHNDKEIGFLLQWDDRIKDVAKELPWKPTEVNLEAYGVVEPPLRTGSSDITENPSIQEYGVDKERKGEKGSLAGRQHTYPQYNDAVAIQFPVQWKGANGQPQFTQYFWGVPGNPADIMKWSADGRLAAYKGTGWNQDFQNRELTSQLKVLKSEWKEGHWTVILTRPLKGNSKDDAALESDALIPTVFFSWDGHNGDAGRKMLASKYYFLHLQPKSGKARDIATPAVPKNTGFSLPGTFEVLKTILTKGKDQNPLMAGADDESLFRSIQVDKRSPANLINASGNPWAPDANKVLKAVREGGSIYFQNCHFCHADNLNGTAPPTGGFWGFASSPRPTSFMSASALPTMSELYTFWRVAKGGLGLPQKNGAWSHSTMPAMEEHLSIDDMWKVVLFMYWQTGTIPPQ